jgi:hypothetical protein
LLYFLPLKITFAHEAKSITAALYNKSRQEFPVFAGFQAYNLQTRAYINLPTDEAFHSLFFISKNMRSAPAEKNS